MWSSAIRGLRINSCIGCKHGETPLTHPIDLLNVDQLLSTGYLSPYHPQYAELCYSCRPRNKTVEGFQTVGRANGLWHELRENPRVYEHGYTKDKLEKREEMPAVFEINSSRRKEVP
jgi:hypothetical protein